MALELGSSRLGQVGVCTCFYVGAGALERRAASAPLRLGRPGSAGARRRLPAPTQIPRACPAGLQGAARSVHWHD